MISTHDEQPDAESDREIRVTHFIPSVQLKGTRADKLEKLDLLIAHLEGLRRSIAEQPGASNGVEHGSVGAVDAR
jgi:hypothetical protein